MNIKQILFFKPTEHFLQRMEERDISKEKILDVISEGTAKFQRPRSGVIEFVKDKIKVIVDLIDKKLITVMHVYEKYAGIYDIVTDLEIVVLASIKEKEINPENKLKFEDEVKIKELALPIPTNIF